MSILDKIINISKKIIEEKYSEHLSIVKKLKLSELELNNILKDSFDNNNWKELIRNKLKEEYKEEYPKSSVENIFIRSASRQNKIFRYNQR